MGKRGISFLQIVLYHKSQKGQVTYFIIVGLILVAVIIGIFYLRERVIKSEFERLAEKAAVVSEQVKPIKAFIDDCIKETAEDGIALIGLQGGYNTIPNDLIPLTSAGNVFSNSLHLFPGRENRIAYWYYISGNNVEINQIPKLEAIEDELETYIKINVGVCFREVSLEGYAISGQSDNLRNITELKADVNILENVVQIIIDYPVTINTKGLSFNMPKHYISIDSGLGHLYSLAKTIFDAEERNLFLEEKTTDMLVVYEDIPYSGVEFDCTPKIWFKSSVANSLKDALTKNIAFIRVRGSEYKLSDIDNYYFEWNIQEGDFKGVGVDFLYSKNWPLFIDIAPSKNDMLQSENIVKQTGELGSYISPFFCLNSYNFVYDIKYPVLISLLSDKGEIFRFAILVVIDNNQPRRDKLSNPEISELETSPEICRQGIVDLSVNTIAPDKSDPYGKLRFLDGVDVNFKCITTTCILGRSINGVARQRVPACTNGLLIGEKGGYYPGEMLISTNLDAIKGGTSETSLILEPFYNVSATVKVIDKDKGLRNPYESEQIIFRFKSDSGYNAIFIYPEMKNVMLIADNYDVESYVTGKSTWDIKIQGQTIEKCVKVPRGILGVFGFEEEKCVEAKIPDMFIDEAIKGGADFRWNPTRTTLIDASTGSSLIFYTFSGSIPTTYEKLEEAYESIEFNARRSDFRLPEVK